MKPKHLLLFFLIPFFSYAQPASFSSRGVGGGGALFSLSINPANNSEYYVSCDMGELFHTNDFGNSYSQVHFQEVIGGHNSTVCFTNTSVRYTLSYANDMVRPMKSTDNGINWTALSGNPDDYEETYSIHADYNNSNRVIISTYGNIYFSSNGGTTFSEIHEALTDAGNVVGGVFFDGDFIYIGTNDGVLVSTNAGVNWTTAGISGLAATDRILSFAAAKSGGTTRFFCVTAHVDDVYVGVVGSDYGIASGVYSVNYGSGNWTSRLTDINLNEDYPMFVRMAENNIDVAYLAGSNAEGLPDIIKTTNGGSNWSHVFNTTNNGNIATGWSGQGGDRGWGYGECPFGIAVAANDPNYVIFGDFGFVHKTNNGGTNWQQAYVNTSDQHNAGTNTPTGQSYESVGLENTTCWQIHWVNASTMWACYSDIRGMRSTDGGDSWSFNFSGHNGNTSYRVAQHPTNGTLYAASSNVHDMYQSTRLGDDLLDANDANGKIIYSTNNGQTWQNLHVFNHPVFWIELDPSNPNRAYASVIHYNGGSGVGGIYICNDLQNLSTSTWTLLSNPPRTEKHPACIRVLNDGKMVCTYSGRRAPGFTASSGVFIYDPVGNSWSDVSDDGMHYWTKDIVIAPGDPSQNTWYVGVFSGWGGAANELGGLYKTTNRGTSWTKLTDIEDMDRVTSCTFDPNNVDRVYITTEAQGLWMSNNINSATPTFSQVQSYPFQQPERVFFNPHNNSEVWVSSFGNGMKMGTVTVTGLLDFNSEKEKLFDVFPNPTSKKLNIRCEKFSGKKNKIELYDLSGKLILEKNLSATEQEVSLNGLKPSVYSISLISDGMLVGTQKVVIEE